jgi:pSer/pThr/pTyr-binding forkhead associated (FHA) protein
MNRFVLVVTHPSGQHYFFPLREGAVTLGRNNLCDIILSEEQISRRHAKLSLHDNVLTLEDLSSHNGTFINGKRITEAHTLAGSEFIAIGSFRLSISEPDAPPPAKLCILSKGFLAGRIFHLDRNEISLGRKTNNDIILRDPAVSRSHAKITIEDGRYFITDLKSANGIFINGEEYQRAQLQSGDKIDIGYLRLLFVDPNEKFIFDDSMIEDTQEPNPKVVTEVQETENKIHCPPLRKTLLFPFKVEFLPPTERPADE